MGKEFPFFTFLINYVMTRGKRLSESQPSTLDFVYPNVYLQPKKIMTISYSSRYTNFRKVLE